MFYSGDDMLQVRFHGRGGQGVVTAAEILSIAAFEQGLYAQAFPSFGSERTGAPVMAFCRTDTKPIRLREPILKPDAVVIQDPTLLALAELWAGVTQQTLILINTEHTPAEIASALPHHLAHGRIVTVDATRIAFEHVKRPLPNAALLGALLAVVNPDWLASLRLAITHKFSGTVGQRNAEAASAAWKVVSDSQLSTPVLSP